eukprot:2546406-Rhodomonas_salina.1
MLADAMWCVALNACSCGSSALERGSASDARWRTERARQDVWNVSGASRMIAWCMARNAYVGLGRPAVPADSDDGLEGLGTLVESSAGCFDLASRTFCALVQRLRA